MIIPFYFKVLKKAAKPLIKRGYDVCKLNQISLLIILCLLIVYREA